MNGTIRIYVDELLKERSRCFVDFTWRTRSNGEEIRNYSIEARYIWIQGVYTRSDSGEELEKAVPLSNTRVVEKLEELTDEDNYYVAHKTLLRQLHPDEEIIYLDDNAHRGDIDYYLWEPDFTYQISTQELVAQEV